MTSRTIGELIASYFPDGTVQRTEEEDGPFKLSSPHARFPYWPPDLFAAMADIIEKSGAYAFWNPGDQALLEISHEAAWVGETWRHDYIDPLDHYRYEIAKKVEHGTIADPDDWTDIEFANNFIQSRWDRLIGEFKDRKLADVLEDDELSQWGMIAIELLIVADEACAELGLPSYVDPDNEEIDDDRPWAAAFLDSILHTGERSFISEATRDAIWVAGDSSKGVFETLTMNFDASIAKVVPKSRTPQLGATLRAFSHHVALVPSSQEVRTTWYQSPTAYSDNRILNLLIVPFPYEVSTNAFVPRDVTGIENGRWGSFTIAQTWLETFGTDDAAATKFVEFVDQLIKSAQEGVAGPVDAIVFPEAVLSARFFDALAEHLLTNTDIEMLIAGIAGKITDFEKVAKRTGENKEFDVNVVGIAHFAPGEAGGRVASVFYQHKHHRWRLDRAQLKSYGLSARLGGVEHRWEHISTNNRHIQFLPIRRHATLATLVCEDLARIDPCQSVLRAVGPSLVIALLLDGPQLTNRWPGRYATVLAEDPGSSVLTLTAAGMLQRSNQTKLFEPSNVVALWRDSRGLTPISLQPDQSAIVLSLDARSVEERTLDDRPDGGVATSYELVQQTPVSHAVFKYAGPPT